MNFIRKFINNLKISIFKLKDYNKLIEERLSSAIIYGLLLSVLLGVVGGIFNSYGFRKITDEIVDVLKEDNNKFVLEDGILNFEKSPTKYEKGKFILYIDTNKTKSEISSLRNVLVHKDYSITVLSDGIVMDFSGYTQDISFIKDKNIVTNEDLIENINKFSFLGNFIIIFKIVQILLSMVMGVLMLSILGQIIAILQGIRISYKNIIKICIYAITFTTIISQVVYLGSFKMLINGFYLIAIIKRINKQSI